MVLEVKVAVVVVLLFVFLLWTVLEFGRKGRDRIHVKIIIIMLVESKINLTQESLRLDFVRIMMMITRCCCCGGGGGGWRWHRHHRYAGTLILWTMQTTTRP